jgi:transposase-like protein
MRGKPHSAEVKAQVMAALMAGQGVSEVARAHDLPVKTVHEWASSPEFAKVRTQKGDRVQELTFGYLEAVLTTLTKQAEAVSEKTYIHKQPASEIAVLHGVMADKAFRLLSAIPSAAVQPDSDPE